MVGSVMAARQRQYHFKYAEHEDSCENFDEHRNLYMTWLLLGTIFTISSAYLFVELLFKP